MPHIPGANLLLVEGKDEKRVIPELLEKNGVQWELGPKAYCVDIQDTGGVEVLLDVDTLKTYSKRSGLQRLGIVVDADSDPVHRWNEVRSAVLNAGFANADDLPITPRRGGLVVALSHLKLGIWIMPNNHTSGMLETFLGELVQSEDGKKLDTFASEKCLEALSNGATFKNPTQLDKARIHCWLAWQDEPGRQLHQAVLFGLLDAKSPRSQPFVSWFRDLYELT
jgi:hypothetical protein